MVYTTPEAAEYCKCSIWMIRELAKKSNKKRYGRTWVFSQRELDHIIENGVLPNSAPATDKGTDKWPIKSPKEQTAHIGRLQSQSRVVAGYAEALALP